jgi:hypothetical protein
MLPHVGLLAGTMVLLLLLLHVAAPGAHAQPKVAALLAL